MARIPHSIDKFNAFIINTNTYLLAGLAPNLNWQRVGWTAAEMTQWTAFVTQWNPLYAMYSNKKESRTTAVTNKLHLIIKQLVALDKSNHLLDRIASSPNSTIDDLHVFNIKKGVLQDNTATRQRAPISDSVVAGLQSIGGGDVKITGRTSHDSKRPSLADGADSTQYAYQIAGTAPTSADAAGLTKEISTRAQFTLHTGAVNSGKTLFIFFRWYNTKHPELAGPWSAMQTVLIL